MDLGLLESHAKGHGEWTINLTHKDRLVCNFNQPSNSEGRSWEDYSYYLNGVRISLKKANDLLESMLEQEIA